MASGRAAKQKPMVFKPSPGAGPTPWASKILNMNQVLLFNTYGREATIHRDMMVSGAPVPSSWRHFRQFMLEVGPAPEGDDVVLAVLDESDKVYNPGRVRWAKPTEPRILYWKKDGSQGAWNRERPNARSAEDELLSRLSRLDGSGEEEDSVERWMPKDPEKQASFNKTFRMWQAHVKPAYKGSARPAFLFLYTALFVLTEARAELIAAGLWTSDSSRADELHAHPAWRTYCDQLRRAEAALSSLPEFQGYSPHSQLDALRTEVVRSELQFRTG